MKAITDLIDRLTGGVGVLAAWLIAPLALSSGYEVFARYVLGQPTIWAFELGYMLTGANFLLGAALAMRDDAHIRVDVLYGRFSDRTKAIVNGLTYVLIVIPFCAWLALALWHYAFDAYMTQEGSGQSAWNPVVWPFRCVFFVAFALLALQAVAELRRCARLIFAAPASGAVDESPIPPGLAHVGPVNQTRSGS